MAYSQEFITWTNATGLTADFVIEAESEKIPPNGSNDLSCVGIGFSGMTKNNDGLLQMKVPSSAPEGYDLITWYSILDRYGIKSL
jgi:hypothetical protein